MQLPHPTLVLGLKILIACARWQHVNMRNTFVKMWFLVFVKVFFFSFIRHMFKCPLRHRILERHDMNATICLSVMQIALNKKLRGGPL